MNIRMVRFVLGRILLVEGLLMIPSLLVTLLYREGLRPAMAFVFPIVLLVLIGFLMCRRMPEKTSLYARDGLAIVAMAWVLMSLFGALPFWLSGDIPNFVDCFFETVSGFTTTGSTILTAVEPLGKGVLFWRSFTHWVGGMGVLVFVMAVLPMSDGHGMHLMRAEVPGPTVGKLVSRMSDTAKILYGIYFAMTILLIVLLMFGGMDLYDSCIHAFGAAGTGGFSNRNLSVGAYDSVYFDVVIGTFMLLFGVNFNLYYLILIKRAKDAFASEELRAYLLIVAVSVLLITADICSIYDSVWTSLRHAYFQVSSIVTTTGYTTVDFNTWPGLSKTILVLLMFIGACAGSTGGGLKVSRILILVKASIRDMRRMLHPNAIVTVHFEQKPLDEKTVRSSQMYLTVYVLVFVLSVLLLSFEEMDLVTTFTAVAACLNNIGPGLEIVGPMGNFASLSWASKLLLSLNMLIGRLEIFPMILIFAPSIWKRKRSATSLQQKLRNLRKR